MKPLTIAEKACLYDAIADMARIRGLVTIIDRLGSSLVAVGGEHQTSEGETTAQAVSAAAWKMGLDSTPRSAPTLSLTRDTIPTVPLIDTDEGGPD